ncbi:MAG: hypothetical protein HC767_02815 [Akkermansiaceae bacterium]|nr:hypothetical protein [Akkermansiaceae bacterium]
MSEKKRTPLTKEQREELLQRHLAGETAVLLSKEFGVSQEYVRLLKRQHLDPERFIAKEEKKLSKKLTAKEIQKFTEALATTTPMDHDFPPHPKWWDLDHGANLAQKLFGKTASMRLLKDLMAPYIPKRSDFKWEKPSHRDHLGWKIFPRSLQVILATWLTTCLPLITKVRQREYELALADYEERFAEEDERAEKMNSLPAGDFQTFSSHQQAGKRIGKHAKSKGSPFTKPKAPQEILKTGANLPSSYPDMKI